jgi:ankyrin repeat protein
MTPLWHAALNGHKEVIKLLLETGKVDVEAKNTWGETLLSETAKKGNEGVLKLLLEASKADVD